jgi:predicted phage terminase large subunit-like protein
LSQNNYPDNLLTALLHQDFYSFINKVFNHINPSAYYKPNWHIELIAEYLIAMQNGEIKRLIINMPPRSLKSICVSIAWPAWLLGHNPAQRIMVASYSQILSIQHSLDCKLIMNSDWYKQIFPSTILSNKHNQKSKFLTDLNGFRFATSVGGSATGEGGDFLIIDDPHNPSHINSIKMRNKVIEWFSQVFITRLNDKKKGGIILVMQRLHEEDLSGYLLSDDNNLWHQLKIPIQAPHDIIFTINDKKYKFYEGATLHAERENTDDLLKLENDLGIYNYKAQYLQSPIAYNCSLLQLQDISFYDKMDNKFDYFIQSWDTAIKISENADYSVCTCFGVIQKIYYLVSMTRSKFTYPDLKKEVEKLAKKYQPRTILIEDKASGQQIIQDLRFDGFNNIIAIKPKLDKITRFASIVPLFQAGIILLPKQSNFNNILLKELITFPNSKNDDIIDSISQFLNFTKGLNAKKEARIRIF